MLCGAYAGILHFFCLIAISWNQPTRKVDGWGLPRIEDRSYETGYFPTPGYRPGHFNRHYGGYTTESYRPEYQKTTHFPQRNNRQGEDSEVLSRRTIDVGLNENGPQSLGSKKSRYNEKEILLSRRFRKIRKYRNRRARKRREDSNLASADMTNRENTENEAETARALTTSPGRGGGSGQKRPGTDGAGKGSHSHRGGSKPKHPSHSSNKRNHTQNSDFVFPDNVASFIPRSSICGAEATFCQVAAEDYPKEYITELLKKEGNRFKEVFGRDSILEMNITERLYKDETDLCTSSQRLIFPNAAQNTKGNWQFIVNQEGYVQGIGVETCESAEKPCKMTDGFPLSYKTSCKQKYVTRRLVSINNNGGSGMNEFLFPSCCVCILQSVGLGTRSKTRS